MVSEQFVDIKKPKITLGEYEELIDVRTRMEILTEYRMREKYVDDTLLDILCGISRDENFAAIPSAAKRHAKVIKEIEEGQED